MPKKDQPSSLIQKDNANGSSRTRIIGAINTPLGFFVLALLIVESFLGLVLSVGKLDQKDAFWGMVLGVVMFVLVVLIVAFIVMRAPSNLLLDQESIVDLEKSERKKKAYQEKYPI